MVGVVHLKIITPVLRVDSSIVQWGLGIALKWSCCYVSPPAECGSVVPERLGENHAETPASNDALCRRSNSICPRHRAPFGEAVVERSAIAWGDREFGIGSHKSLSVQFGRAGAGFIFNG